MSKIVSKISLLRKLKRTQIIEKYVYVLETNIVKSYIHPTLINVFNVIMIKFIINFCGSTKAMVAYGNESFMRKKMMVVG